MGALASESVAANFEQREQIRQLEAHYDEAVALAAARERVVAPESEVIASRIPGRAVLEREPARNGSNGSNGSNGTNRSTDPSPLSRFTVAE
jgi:hypothetical protein